MTSVTMATLNQRWPQSLGTYSILSQRSIIYNKNLKACRVLCVCYHILIRLEQRHSLSELFSLTRTKSSNTRTLWRWRQNIVVNVNNVILRNCNTCMIQKPISSLWIMVILSNFQETFRQANTFQWCSYLNFHLHVLKPGFHRDWLIYIYIEREKQLTNSMSNKYCI